MRHLWVGLLWLLCATAAWAQTEVAIVNVDDVIRRARPIRSEIDAVDAEVGMRQRDLDERGRELQSLIDTFRAQSELWSEEVVNQQQREIIERRLALEEMEDELVAFLDEMEETRIQPALRRIHDTIGVIAEENGIDLVLRSDASVFALPDLDITQEVIDLLNRNADAQAASAVSGESTE